MIRKFIRNQAIKSWAKELDEFVDWYASKTRQMQADYFIYSVRTRAGFQLEGNLPNPDGTINTGAELSAYPFAIARLERMIGLFNKNGTQTEALCLSIWLHTLRSFLYPELKPRIDQLWAIIMFTEDLWPQMLEKHYNDDTEDERIKKEMLGGIYSLAKEILKTLPPKTSVN